MISGFYEAGGAMAVYADRNDIIANNLANVATPGFKKESVYVEPFDVLFARVTQPVAGEDGLVQPPLGRLRSDAVTVYTQGPLRGNGGKFDLAINGDGFFKVNTPAGIRYTRDGAFRLDATGRLVTADGYEVLGEGDSPITITADEGRDVVVAEDGTVTVGGTRSGKIALADFEKPYPLRKVGHNLLEPVGEDMVETVAEGSIVQHSLEMSNVNAVEEMVALITNFRGYEIAQRMARLQDQSTQQAINVVGAAK